ncbi:hypothetical protein CspHIS471_0606010 [Cutaneotrichosporon sp. HIS471]|nr:hypothetical protein CspHIS471_0606010 [Cutaneotrichosporon sp. HIS471]
MALVPRVTPNDSTNPASVAVGVGVGVGVTLLLVLLVAIGFLIWRRHKRAYNRKPDASSPIYRPGTAVVRQPAVEPGADSAGQVVRPTPEAPASPRALARHSLPSPPMLQSRPSTAKPPARASMSSSTNSDKSTAELEAREHFVDLATRPDLLPPSFLPHALHSEESRYSFTNWASAGPLGFHAQDATAVGLDRFTSEWLMSSSADCVATSTSSNPSTLTMATPRVRFDSSGHNPIRMEKVKDDDSPSEGDHRLRLLSFESTTGSRSTGSMSSEGGREMHRQLRHSLQFPIPHPLVAPREVQRHRPNSTRSMVLTPPLSVAVEGLDRRTPRRETWAYGDTNDTLLALPGDLGPWHASGNVSKASLPSPPATPRPALRGESMRAYLPLESLPPVTKV